MKTAKLSAEPTPSKISPKVRKLLDRAIEPSQLPFLVSRPVAVLFSGLSSRTFRRAERSGLIVAIKRNRSSTFYRRSDLLAYLGIEN
jgi:hypothetical protein